MLDGGHQLHYGNNNGDMLLELFGLNHSLSWRKHMGTVAESPGTPTGSCAALLAYMSDEGLSTVRCLTRRLRSHSTSLDLHSLPRAFRSDEWLLFHNETTVSSGERGRKDAGAFHRIGLLQGC